MTSDHGKPPPPWWPIFIEVEAERFRQLEKWGDQRGKRLDGTNPVFYRGWAREYQRQNDARLTAGKRPGVWSKILLEEVYEALSETETEKLAHELIQVAAVCVAWLEDLAQRVEGVKTAASKR